MTPVETLGVGAIELAHILGQIGRRELNQQMTMIVHETGSGATATFWELLGPVTFKGTFGKLGNYALQSVYHQEEVALTAASIPIVARHESPVYRINSIHFSPFHSRGAPHKE